MKTSWEESAAWYDKLVGTEGHYYHQALIFPKLLPLLNLTKDSSLLDLGCGQGILREKIPDSVSYLGIDLSKTLISLAKKRRSPTNTSFLVWDATTPLPDSTSKKFSHATLILSLQNMANPEGAIHNSSLHLQPKGVLAIVLNHPCFRIPRQSSWGVDSAKKLQFRRIDSYLSSLKIPIQTSPSQEHSEESWSFHSPLSTLSSFLYKANFSITLIEEWASNKQSTGSAAKMENRARAEFPLFLTLLCKKNS